MSHAAMSASETGLPSPGVPSPGVPSPGAPSPGVSAKAAAAGSASRRASAQRALRVDMLDLPAAFDPPAGDAVVMLVGESQNRRRCLGLAAQRHELGARRLHVAGFVP